VPLYGERTGGTPIVHHMPARKVTWNDSVRSDASEEIYGLVDDEGGALAA